MIRVTSATWVRGHTGWDQLLDDTALSSVVGRRYTSGEAALAAASSAAAGKVDSRCTTAPIRLTWTDAAGAGCRPASWAGPCGADDCPVCSDG